MPTSLEITPAPRTWTIAANEIHSCAIRHLFDTEQNRFLRSLTVEHGQVHKDHTVDSSVAGLFLCRFLPSDDPRMVATMEQFEARLWVNTHVGGVARYEADTYYQCSDDRKNVPGNPWFLCTLWLAQWHILRATRLAELDKAVDLLRWCIAHALPSGVLAEQIHPYSGAPLSVSPLTWSHATFVATVCQLRDKRRLLLEEDKAGAGKEGLESERKAA